MRECAARGHVVRAAHRRADEAARAFPGAEVAAFDFLDRATWPVALDGCDGILLVRPPPIADMGATLNPFVDAAYAAGVRYIVFVSVARADQMKWVPHRKVELHLIESGSAWTILRPGFFAQNLADAYRRDIAEDARLYVPAGHGRVAFLDVHDIATVAAHVFDAPEAHRGAVHTLTGPEAITFDEVARILSDVLARPIRYEPASIAGYAHHLRRHRNMPWMQILVQTILHVGLRRGDAEQVEPTVAQITGRPPGSLRDYVERDAALWQPAT